MKTGAAQASVSPAQTCSARGTGRSCACRGGCSNGRALRRPPGDGGDKFRAAFLERILPGLDDFGPDLIIVSAGFDAHLRDPLAQLRLIEADFAWATEKLMEAAAKHANGRLVSSLEGGYDLDALAASAAIHVETLMGADS